FEDGEAAETPGIEQGVGLGDTTTHTHRLEVRSGGVGLPAPATLLDELIDPPRPEERGLGVYRIGWRELVERDVGGDVLRSGVGEIVAATLVSTIGAQPLPPREGGQLGGATAAVVDHEHGTVLETIGQLRHHPGRL